MVPDRAARKESLQWLGCSLQGDALQRSFDQHKRPEFR
jgi:hypothetical protein